MANLRLNQLDFTLDFGVIKIGVSKDEKPLYSRVLSSRFKGTTLPELFSQTDVLYFKFDPDPVEEKIEVNLQEHRYFIKPYIDHLLSTYFRDKGLIANRTFIYDTEIWIPVSKKEKYQEFDVFSYKIILQEEGLKHRLLLSYHGKSNVSLLPLSSLDIGEASTKYIYQKEIIRKIEDGTNSSKCYPIISNELRPLFNVPYPTPGRNNYKEYYLKVLSFYEKYLFDVCIGNQLKIKTDGFLAVAPERIHRIRRVSNSLKFNGGTDYNVHNGLKSYGPFYAPDTQSLRFIFIYDEELRDKANMLYSALKKGHDRFPGLTDYVKIKFELATENKIILNTDDHIKELNEKLDNYKYNKGINYFAIVLSKHKKFDNDLDNDEEYYKIKYALLKRNILSQFIYHGNIGNKNFTYFLPNISVAILAKIGGIPWKLDTYSSNSIVVGFGIKKERNQSYLGNTLCFRQDGVFFDFESYARADLNSIGQALKDSLTRVIQQEKNIPDRLVIHFYKTLSSAEARQIELVLKTLDLSIPFIVLTINDSKSKDYLFFDVSYDNIMPVSGTIVETKKGQEYLIANNGRYSETQSYGISKFPFPIKVKINKSKPTLTDDFEIHDLLDQVYSFSRIYWKSIGQTTLPVTISYAKIVADLAAHFPNNQLPDLNIAHKNLWFL